MYIYIPHDKSPGIYPVYMHKPLKPRRLRGVMPDLGEKPSVSVESGRDSEITIVDGESMIVVIPKEGATYTIREERDRDGRRFNAFVVELSTPSGKPFKLRCSETLSKKIQKVSLLLELPVKVKITRTGATQRDTRYSIEAV